MGKQDIYWNKGKKPVFITMEFKEDPEGGPGIATRQICVAPGDGIDVSILGFEREATPTEPHRAYVPTSAISCAAVNGYDTCTIYGKRPTHIDCQEVEVRRG